MSTPTTTPDAARRAALAMDGVIVAVAALTMAFSLGNIHDFALAHGTEDPIAWFLAPAVDLALIGALMGDAVLSRAGLDAGPWAARLRWFAGIATVTLNVWESVAARDAAGIVLHAVPPILLFVLAEAAVPYRRQFAAAVHRATVDTLAPAPVDTPAPAAVDPVSTPVDVDTPAPVEQPLTDPAPAVSEQVAPVDTPTVDQVDTDPVDPAPVDTARLSTTQARAVIEAGWRDGRSARSVAVDATRHHSYVTRVYRELETVTGPQPIAGQLALVKEEATA